MKNCVAAFLVCVVLSVAAPASAAAPTVDDAVAAIDAYAPQALAEQRAPGMIVAITDRTHTIRILTYGYADVEARTKVNEQTRFPIGSITKSMTALAMMEEVDAGRIDLNAPVTRYLPDYRVGNVGSAILVHELLSHTAGIPDDWSSNFMSAGFALAALRGAHTIFAPGTSWAYSNDGFATAGAVLEAATGRAWQDEIAQHVFAPLGMTSSVPYMTPDLFTQEVAAGYVIRHPELAFAPDFAQMRGNTFTMVDPAGSVVASAEDMARYMRLYLNGGKTELGTPLVSAARFAAMTHADHLKNGKLAGATRPEIAEWPAFYRQYGYGLSVFDENRDHLVGHTGGIGGYTACMQINETRGFGVIAMSNLIEAPLHPCAIVRYAMQVLRAQNLGDALPATPSPAPDARDAKDAATAMSYQGTYRGQNTTFSISPTGKRALLSHNGALSPVKFIDADVLQVDDPAFSRFYLVAQRGKDRSVAGFWNGGVFYASVRYKGRTTWRVPERDKAFVGRYQMENDAFGSTQVLRVVSVAGQLTIDGIQPLKRSGSSFALGKSIVRFDSPFAGKMQRMFVDGFEYYRVNLP